MLPAYEFVARMARELPQMSCTQVADFCDSMMRLGRAYHRIQVARLAGEVGDRDSAGAARLEKTMQAACGVRGLRALFFGSPVGATVRIVLPSGASDAAGEGWCVPGS